MKQRSIQSGRDLYTGAFVIDKITNSIEEKTTGKSFSTDIVLATAADINRIYKKDGWIFNWKKEYHSPNRQVYKLLLQGDEIIQGLISLEIKTNERFVEMHLIETAPKNYGKNKLYMGVAGNLVAFACKVSFDTGMEGYVAFTAKSKLINHYKETLGAQLLGSNNRMSILPEQAKNLVNLYFKS